MFPLGSSMLNSDEGVQHAFTEQLHLPSALPQEGPELVKQATARADVRKACKERVRRVPRRGKMRVERELELELEDAVPCTDVRKYTKARSQAAKRNLPAARFILGYVLPPSDTGLPRRLYDEVSDSVHGDRDLVTEGSLTSGEALNKHLSSGSLCSRDEPGAKSLSSRSTCSDLTSAIAEKATPASTTPSGAAAVARLEASQNLGMKLHGPILQHELLRGG